MLFLLQLDQKKYIKVTGTKLYVSIVTLSNQDNSKLLQKLIGTNINQKFHQKNQINIKIS